MTRVRVDELIVSDEAGFACSKSKLVEEGLPHLRPFNIAEGGGLDFAQVFLVPPDEAPKGKSQLLAGDILFNNTNSAELVGKSAVVGEPMTAGYSNHLTRIRVDRSRVVPMWLGYWLRRLRSTGYFTVNATQWVSQAAYRTSDLRKLDLELPPLDEQRRIVDLLSRAEGIVRLRREAQAKAAEIIPALFLDMFGDPATNPKGWPFIAINELVTPIEFGISAALSKDAEYRPGRTGVLRIANLTGDGRLDLSDVRYLSVSEKKRSQLLLREGDILFNWRNSPKWIGKTAIVEKGIDCIFASFLYRFRALDDRSDKTFLWFYLNFLRERGVFESMCRQAVSQANLGRDELGVIRIMIPPIEAQLTFAKKCEALFSIRRQLDEADAKAETAFGALLSRAFSNDLGAVKFATEEAAVA